MKRFKLPFDLIKQLNALGYGGRTLYVPALPLEETPSTAGKARQVEEAMLELLRAGRALDLRLWDKTPRSTLYRLRKRALQRFAMEKHQTRALTDHVGRAEAVEWPVELPTGNASNGRAHEAHEALEQSGENVVSLD